MKKVKISVLKTACYTDLIEKYENPIPSFLIETLDIDAE